nr:immunoglobulin light chain junction region [Macaca mulatta]
DYYSSSWESSLNWVF